MYLVQEVWIGEQRSKIEIHHTDEGSLIITCDEHSYAECIVDGPAVCANRLLDHIRDRHTGVTDVVV